MSAGRPARLASGATRRRLFLVAGGLSLSLAAACSAGSEPAPRHHAPAAHSPAPAPLPTASEPLSLQITPAAYQLPSGISREVVLASGGRLLIIGGLDQRSVTTRVVTELNPVTGRAVRAGRLAAASHDAAGALLGGTQ